jgi:ferredoxin
MDRIDERDTIFSRMTLMPGTERYERYYKRHPEKKEIDDTLRDAPPGKFSHAVPEAPMVETTFAFITTLRDFVRGFEGEYQAPECLREEISSSELTAYLKKTLGSYGAVVSGATLTDKKCAYSIRGRGERYGRKTNDLLPFTVVYAMEMSVEEMRTAPGIREAAEVASTYLRVAVPGLVIASYLRGLGYNAVCHMDGESELVLPPIAEQAGIGQIGRHGLIVNKKYGSRIRLGAVTTDAPLQLDKPVDFKLPKVCEVCRKCSELCPVGAIPQGSIIDDYAAMVRSIDHETCFSAWKQFGTDCGVCVSACPYSKVGGSGAGGNAAEGSSDHAQRTSRPGDPDFLKAYMFGSSSDPRTRNESDSGE